MPRKGRFCWKNLKNMNKFKESFVIGLFVLILLLPSAMQADIMTSGGGKSTAGLLPAVPAIQASMPMKITAYSSSVDETDSTPFITASGMHVRDGIVATNMLPFGTKVELPALFGDKVFVVEDRMAKRMVNVLDIWMPSKGAALRFGVNHTDVVILAPENISLK